VKIGRLSRTGHAIGRMSIVRLGKGTAFLKIALSAIAIYQRHLLPLDRKCIMHARPRRDTRAGTIRIPDFRGGATQYQPPQITPFSRTLWLQSSPGRYKLPVEDKEGYTRETGVVVPVTPPFGGGFRSFGPWNIGWNADNNGLVLQASKRLGLGTVKMK
jgi:hypothetical protein